MVAPIKKRVENSPVRLLLARWQPPSGGEPEEETEKQLFPGTCDSREVTKWKFYVSTRFFHFNKVIFSTVSSNMWD